MRPVGASLDHLSRLSLRRLQAASRTKEEGVPRHDALPLLQARKHHDGAEVVPGQIRHMPGIEDPTDLDAPPGEGVAALRCREHVSSITRVEHRAFGHDQKLSWPSHELQPSNRPWGKRGGFLHFTPDL